MAGSDVSDITITKKKWLAGRHTIFFILVMLVVCGWVGWKYLLQTPTKDILLVLRADDTPFRVKPAGNSQADIPNQDSTFMNLIDGSAEAEKNSEVISLSDPAPEPPPVAVTKTKDEIQTFKENDQEIQDIDVQIQQPTQNAKIDGKQPVNGDIGTTGDLSESGTIQENFVSTDAEQTKLEVVDLTAALNAPAIPTPRPELTKPGQGQMMVQLAAFRKEDKAKTAAALLNQKHADRLQGYRLDVQSIKSTDGQLFWRVITNPIPKQDALSICDGLKRAGQDCIIRQTKAQKP